MIFDMATMLTTVSADLASLTTVWKNTVTMAAILAPWIRPPMTVAMMIRVPGVATHLNTKGCAPVPW